MRTIVTIIFVVGTCWMVPASWAGAYKAPAIEVMALPTFCWGQYTEERLAPEFYIRDCGVGMNHYCGALLAINGSAKAKSKGEKEQLLRSGLKETVYTLNWMKDYPSCPIRSHVEATFHRVRTQLGLPNAPVPGAPTSERRSPEVTPSQSSSARTTTPETSSSSVAAENSVGESKEAGAPTPASAPPPLPEKPANPKKPNCRFCPD